MSYILLVLSETKNSMEDNIHQLMIFDILINNLLDNAMIPKGGNKMLITFGNKRAEQLKQQTWIMSANMSTFFIAVNQNSGMPLVSSDSYRDNNNRKNKI